MNIKEKVEKIINGTLNDQHVLEEINGITFFRLNHTLPCYFGKTHIFEQMEKDLEISQKKYLAFVLMEKILKNLVQNEVPQEKSTKKENSNNKHNQYLPTKIEDLCKRWNSLLQQKDVEQTGPKITRNVAATVTTTRKYIHYLPYNNMIGLPNEVTGRIIPFCRTFQYSYLLNISFDPYLQLEVENKKKEIESNLDELIEIAKELYSYINIDEEEKDDLQNYLGQIISLSEELSQYYKDKIERRIYDIEDENLRKNIILIFANLEKTTKTLKERLDYIAKKIKNLEMIGRIGDGIITKYQNKPLDLNTIIKEANLAYKDYYDAHFIETEGTKLGIDHLTNPAIFIVMIQDYICKKATDYHDEISDQLATLLSGDDEYEIIENSSLEKIYKTLATNRSAIISYLNKRYNKLKPFSETARPINNFLFRFSRMLTLTRNHLQSIQLPLTERRTLPYEYALSYFLFEKIYAPTLTREIIKEANDSHNDILTKKALSPAILIPDIFSRSTYLAIVKELNQNRYYFSISHNKEWNSNATQLGAKRKYKVTDDMWKKDCHQYFRHLALNYYPLLESTCIERFEKEFYSIDNTSTPTNTEKVFNKEDAISILQVLTKFIDNTEEPRTIDPQTTFIENQTNKTEDSLKILKSAKSSKHLNDIFKDYYKIRFSKNAHTAFEELATKDYLNNDELRKIADKAISRYRRTHSITKENSFFD